MKSEPFLSIIMPMKNEEKIIDKCLDSIIAQDYPKEKMEVLVIDGMSTDKSREIVGDYGKQYPYIKLVNNPKCFIPAGLNIGLRKSKGEIIVRMDAHAYYYPDYVSQCVWYLLNRDIANVGGPQNSVGLSFVGKCIAHVVSSRFGIGGATFRYGTSEQFTETAFLGAWYRKTLTDMGGWNEEWFINEDQELNARILEKGGKILFTPKIRSIYYCRSSIPGLIRQYFRYGHSRPKTFRAHPNIMRISHLAPPMFVGMLLLLAIGWFLKLKIITTPLSLIAIFYLLFIITAAVAACKRAVLHIPLTLFLLPILHISWGLGFFSGICKFGIPWKAFNFTAQKILSKLAKKSTNINFPNTKKKK